MFQISGTATVKCFSITLLLPSIEDMTSVKLHRGFESLILGFKFISILALILIFLYWSIIAIIHYESGPISSSVSYRFGDDGHGNYEFPAITICLDSFKWIGMSPNGMLNNCSSRSALADALGMRNDFMAYYLMHCTYDMHNDEGEFYIKICFMKDFTPSKSV